MEVVPPTRYVDSGDGLIAYQVVGDGPLDLVYLTGATSHVDVRWDWVGAAGFLRRLASFSRLILFDRRGTGVSDRLGTEALPTWEEWADDLRVVLDAVGSERAAIFAVLDAGPMAMLFAASHPDRTTALVLGNTAARYRADDDYPCGHRPEVIERILAAMATTWGTEAAAVAASPTTADDPTARAWLAKYMRASATPAATAAQWRSVFDGDFRSVLPVIRVPTLVLSRTGYLPATVGMGRYLAEHVPEAELVLLPGADSMYYADDAEAIADTIEEFLTGVRPHRAPDRILATVLFTDLVESTRHAASRGDAEWRRTLDQHDAVSRREVEAHNGRLVKLTGDGLVATFPAPGRAIQCALSLRSAAAGLGLDLRAGLHTGEVEVRGDDIGGIAVHTAARVQSAADPGEILVSRTVVDLVAGSSLTFGDRGDHELKGVPGTWRLFAVRG